MADNNETVYGLLMKVFRDNAYASIELNAALQDKAESDKPYITKLFYGVLERSVYYDYAISRFAADKPKKPIAVILKMGLYMLENMSTPKYAVVDNMVKLCKKLGKGGASGFVNSALRRYAPPELPKDGTAERLSAEFSYPLWLIEILIKDYGYEFVRDMLLHKSEERAHIRVNLGAVTSSEFENKYAEYLNGGENARLKRSGAGYYASRTFLKSANQHDYVVQSAASVIAANAYVYNIGEIKSVLDLCAAPGGKAVLTAQLTGASVTACDIHKHRCELIKKYANRCGTPLTVCVNDATVPNSEWENAFDLVVCDVPCSGIGVAGSKPDILFNRSAGDIDELCVLQQKILSTASKYVKVGGRLCYSTCTVIKKENREAVSLFLSEHGNFKRVKIKSLLSDSESEEINLFPHIHNTDGFYVAALERTS